MTWNSPFQPLQNKTNHAECKDLSIGEDGHGVENNNNQFIDGNEDFVDPDLSLNTLLNCNSLLNEPIQQTPLNNFKNYNTDIQDLDSLFSELNSDVNFDQDICGKSEPVNLDDIERILLPQNTRKSCKIHFNL